MATTLRQILDDIDLATTERDHSRSDLAGAIVETGRLLDVLCLGLSDPRFHGDKAGFIRDLAAACNDVKGIFDVTDGPLKMLVGAAADTVGVLDVQVASQDRWAVALCAATIARRAATQLREHGPFTQVRQLATVRHRARQLLVAGAAAPPMPIPQTALDLPLTSPTVPQGADAATAILDHGSAMIALLRMEQGRTLLQMEGVCGSAALVSEAAAVMLMRIGRRAESGQHSEAALAWRLSQKAIRALGVAGTGYAEASSQRLLMRMAMLNRTLRETLARPSESISPGVVQGVLQTARQLPWVAHLVTAEVGGSAGRVLLRRGARPVNESRTADWLAGRSVVATRDDLLLAVETVERAARVSQLAALEPPRLSRAAGVDLSR